MTKTNENVLELDGLLSMGYGIIPKKAMRDARLTPEAKAIYAYLCSFAGSGNTAFPSVDLMCAEIGMSEDRFYRHRKLLVQYGYIAFRQIRGGRGKTGSNVYTILHTQVEKAAEPSRKAALDDRNHQITDPQNKGPQNRDPYNKGPQNKGTINNSPTNNSLKNNSGTNNTQESARDLTDEPETVEKKRKSPKRHKYGEFGNVLLTDDQFERAQERTNGLREHYIKAVDSYCEKTGKTYRNYYAAIGDFYDRDVARGSVPATSKQSIVTRTPEEKAKQPKWGLFDD